MNHRGLIVMLIIVAIVISIVWFSRQAERPPRQTAAQQSVPAARGDLALRVGGDTDYATSSSCRDCHADQYESWHQTWHRTMTQDAASAEIAAPMGKHRLTSHRREFVISRTAEDFRVNMPDPEWERSVQARGADLSQVGNAPRVDRPIVMTTGSHHYQAYWIHGSGGADLHQVPFVYHLEENRWIPKESSFLQKPGPRAEFAIWNHNCIQCHSVGGQPRLNKLTNRFNSHAVELGISCEACHGPSAKHVELAREAAAGDASDHVDLSGLTVNPHQLSKQRSSEVCGQCHGYFIPKNAEVWWDSGWREQYRPGQELEATRTLVRHALSTSHHGTADPASQADDSLYWPDGTVRVGGREYLGLIESACHQQGEMTCLSCHSMHNYEDPNDQLAKSMEGNQACLQCHDSMSDAVEQHTHHLADSSGSQCYNCHMPHTSYALFKAIRSHRIDSPRALTTWESGRPNACNLCHLDKTLSWTAEHLTEWYGHESVELDSERQEISDTVIDLLRGDAAQRAIAVWATGWAPARSVSGTKWMPPYLTQLLQDPYPVIRLMAHRSLRSLTGYGDSGYDFLGRPDERRQVAHSILEDWHKRAESKPQSAPELLINSDGSIDQTLFDRLLGNRDDRPISISE